MHDRRGTTGPRGTFYAVGNGVGEPSRTTGVRPGGSDGTLRLTSVRVNWNLKKGFRPAGDSLASGDTSSAPGCRIRVVPPVPS